MGALDMALVATRYSTTLAPRRYLAKIPQIRHLRTGLRLERVFG